MGYSHTPTPAQARKYSKNSPWRKKPMVDTQKAHRIHAEWKEQAEKDRENEKPE